MKFIEEDIEIEKLLLDPNNYRFQDLDDFVYADDARFHENNVQARTYERLKETEGLKALKGSIIKNTYIPSERIVASKYSDEPEQFLVVEGNRRVAAVKWLLNDYEAGVEIDENVLASVRALPVVILEAAGDEAKVVQASLMGIRHVSGIKQWGAYQRAKLVVYLRDELDLDANDVSERLAMSTVEVNRRYRAFKALTQYQRDEELGEHFRPSLYPVFHEALSLPIVREWLNWNDEASEFQNADELQKFFRCISPNTVDDPDGSVTEYPPKIMSYSQVRNLRSILPNEDARASLLDEIDQTFDEALAIAKQPEIARYWVRSVSSANRALTDMSVAVLKEISDDDLATIKNLGEVITERLADIEQLKKQYA